MKINFVLKNEGLIDLRRSHMRAKLLSSLNCIYNDQIGNNTSSTTRLSKDSISCICKIDANASNNAYDGIFNYHTYFIDEKVTTMLDFI